MEATTKRPFASGYISPGERRNSNCARFPSKLPAVIDLQASLILPLMHHLMQQSMDRFIPPIAADVSAADHDLRLMPCLSAPGVVTKSRLHAARDSNRNSRELTPELHRIQIGVVPGELTGQTLVGWMSSLTLTPCTARRV